MNLNSYDVWMQNISEVEREELSSMDAESIEDAFFRDLVFGTGGLRGKLGLGPNRMNGYTVGRASVGLAKYLMRNHDVSSVVLARDTRLQGDVFLKVAAEIFTAFEIKVYIFDRPVPTPLLSFAVRELGCVAGVNITASHNSAEYNGYKVYGSDGCQITVGAARDIQQLILETDIFSDVKRLPLQQAEDRGLLWVVSNSVVDRYLDAVRSLSTNMDCSSIQVVYTPLHGTGLECAERILHLIGIGSLDFVREQAVQDGTFPTCIYPNPEVPDALRLGLEQMESMQADLLLATDPDADRVGVAVWHKDHAELLTGNDVGLLLLDYLAVQAEMRGDISKAVAFTTIVSTPVADDVARHYGFELRRTLTGFKYIGEQLGLLESQGRCGDFLFGFEESYGYLAGTYARDKDAIVSCMLITELTAYWKSKGKDLFEALEDLYEAYGWCISDLLSITYEGPSGAKRMNEIMERLRICSIEEIANQRVVSKTSYIAGEVMPVVNGQADESQILPPSDVVEIRLGDGSRILIRPSGTEPKIKAYVYAMGKARQIAAETLTELSEAVKTVLEGGEW